MSAPAASQLAYVPFISVDDMMKLIHKIGIQEMIVGISTYIEEDFSRWEQFDKTPRVASHSPEGVIEVMPTSDGKEYAFKYVNGHPKNTSEGLQTVTAFGLLADVYTGYPLLISEMTILTALRTAATSSMVGKYLAPVGAKTMALIGNGAQSEFQALAFAASCGIERFRVYDVDGAATEKLIGNLRHYPYELIPCDSAADAASGADIVTICTADKLCATIMTHDMIAPGTHINAIGGDCPGKTELAREVLEQASVFVEFEPQTRIEGDLQQMPEAFEVTEFWRVVTGEHAGRASEEEVTLFDGVGFAIEDFSALRYVRDRLQDTGSFTPLDMIADPDDPRDLFGMVQRASQQGLKKVM
jgi:ornithine cyclodeaminase